MGRGGEGEGGPGGRGGGGQGGRGAGGEGGGGAGGEEKTLCDARGVHLVSRPASQPQGPRASLPHLPSPPARRPRPRARLSLPLRVHDLAAERVDVQGRTAVPEGRAHVVHLAPAAGAAIAAGIAADGQRQV